jgi:hypothetical protein
MSVSGNDTNNIVSILCQNQNVYSSNYKIFSIFTLNLINYGWESNKTNGWTRLNSQ